MQLLNRRKMYRGERIGQSAPITELLEARRLLSGEGLLAPHFGVGGEVADAALPPALAVAVQPNGKIVEAGSFNGDFEVARFNRNGSIDTNFGAGGAVVTDFGGTDAPSSIVIEPDGKIVVAGNTNGDFAVARYGANGRLDAKFGTGGTVTATFGTPSTLAALGVLKNGAVELYGHGLGQVGGAIYGQQEFVRFTKAGVPDSTFGAGGLFTIASTQPLILGGAAILSDGEVVSGISLSVGHQWQTELVSYNADGSVGTMFPDPFGTNDISFNERAGAVTVQSDGKILFSRYHVFDRVLVRYNADGTLDTTFGTGGVVTTVGDPMTGDLPLLFTSIYEQANGQIVATDGSVVYRYNSDGSADSDFGSDGQTMAPFAAGGVPISIAAGPHNSIVVAGGASTELELARFRGN